MNFLTTLSHTRKRQAVVYLVFLSVIILYSAILLTSQSHIDGDEAVIGIMARHIITRDARPVFYYGQTYGGGGALEAYLAVIPFTLFGQSSISLKLVALVMSLTTLALTYYYCKHYINNGSALVSTVILAAVTPLVEWHTKVRGGYTGLLLSYIAILIVYGRITYDQKANSFNYFILGLVCGLSFYNSALIIPLIMILALGAVYWRKSFWRWQFFTFFLAGFLVSISPLINYEITHDFNYARFIFRLGTSGDKSLSSRIILMISNYLPSFFVGRNVDSYVTIIPAEAWIEYFIFAGLTLYGLLLYRKSIWNILTASFRTNRSTVDKEPPKPESILLLTVLLHLTVCVISKETALSPRYFVPLFPALAMISGSVVNKLWEQKSTYLVALGVIPFAVLMSLGLLTHISYIRPSTVNDDVLLSDGRIINVQTSGNAAEAITLFLKEKDISHVRCAYFLQWRLLFESHESIIASSNGFVPGYSRFREYDYKVDQAQRVAYVFHQNSTQLNDFINTSNSSELLQKHIYEYIIFYPPGN